MIIVLLLGGAWLYFGYSPVPDEPQLRAALQSGSLSWGGIERTYFTYIPPDLPAHAPLLLVLHGSVMNGAQMRITTGFEFDEMADRSGFAVLYPNGYKGHWNDCRTLPKFSAKREQIDDLGFLLALIQQMQEQYQTDPARVYVVGYSNGGHMAFRLRVQAPQVVAGIAIAAASPTVPEDSSCTPRDDNSPVMMVNGTADLLNAYDGGEQPLPGLAPRGRVQASPAAAALFAAHNGIRSAPVQETLPDLDPDDGTRVSRQTWFLRDKPNVVLYTVEGGGHVVPQPEYRFPRMYGRTTGDLNFPAAVLDFFGLAK